MRRSGECHLALFWLEEGKRGKGVFFYCTSRNIILNWNEKKRAAEKEFYFNREVKTEELATSFLTKVNMKKTRKKIH